MRARRTALSCTVGVLLLAGCGGGSEVDGSGGGTSSASCVLRVTIDGVDWWGIGMEHDLARELRGPAIAATQPGCDDVNPGEDPAADDGRPVVLRAIEGLPADEVLFLPGEGLDDQVFVPQEVRSVHELPVEVQELVLRG